MAKAAVAELLPIEQAAAQTGTDIVVAVTQNPGIVLIDRQKFDAWYDKLKSEAPAAGDMASKKDRDTLRSYAAKVRSEKAAIEKARLRLTEEWRTMTTQANDAGKEIKARLEALETEVRAPLTEWEAAEEARVNACRAVIDGFRAAMVVTMDDTAADVRARGTEVYNTAIDPARFGDMADEALFVRDDAIATLKRALARLTQEEAERAELEQLRAESVARQIREREEAEARQRAEDEAAQVRLTEERRAAAEKAEADRIERARLEAAERAKRAVEAIAQAKIDSLHAEHEQALAEERQKALTAQFEAERIREDAERRAQAAAAEAKRIADEQAAREANKAHRTRVKTAAKCAIMTCGVSEDAAQKVVLAIIAGEVPGVSLAF
jgi:colicin import membrane protein